MPDDNGTETTRSDAPSVDESLFGEAAEDTEAAVADEQDAEQDPQGADDAEAQDGAPEALKVVVSIKGAGPPSGCNSPRRTRTSSRSMTWTRPGWHGRSRR